MDPPPAETLIRALEQLYALGALNDKGELTKMGRRMAEIPADPPLAKMLLASERYNCATHILTITSMLSVDANLFYRPRDKLVHADNAHKTFFVAGGDQLTLLNVYNQWKATDYSTQWTFEHFLQFRSLKRARDVRDQLKALCERVEIPIDEDEELRDDAAPLTPEETENVLKAITAGFFYHTAKLQRNGSYKTVKNAQSVKIHPSSSLFQSLPKWVVYNQLVYTSAEFMRSVVEIKPQWLNEIAPHFYSIGDTQDDSDKKLANTKNLGRAATRK
jgi:pre-mRNA-splicing factor ATP-dependent RNA helicase DHX16